MPKPLVQIVTLPGGEKVSISHTPEKWWTKHDASGYADPRLLAPDPDQPRKRMNATKLEEMRKSIASCGVREPLTVTPRALAPWVRLKPEHNNLPFIIVSGHRRDECAIHVRLPAVPIRVRIYEDENAHRSDGGVLNAQREDLTELEQGLEYLRECKAGKSPKQVADAHGINELTVQNRINLTKLHPDLHPLLEPDASTNKRALPIYPASILGGVKPPGEEELEEMAVRFDDYVDSAKVTGHKTFKGLDDDSRRFAMQKLLTAVIMARRLNSVRAAEFIRDRTLKFGPAGHQERTERYQPRRRKDIVVNLAQGVTGSAIVDWTPDEYKRIFANSSREDVDEFIKHVKSANDVFAGVIKILSGIRDAKPMTSAEVLQLIRKA